MERGKFTETDNEPRILFVRHKKRIKNVCFSADSVAAMWQMIGTRTNKNNNLCK